MRKANIFQANSYLLYSKGNLYFCFNRRSNNEGKSQKYLYRFFIAFYRSLGFMYHR